MSYKRIVVKISTNLITKEDNTLNQTFLRSIVSQISMLCQKGIEVVIVSSGAMAAGRTALKLHKESKTLPVRQTLAAVGQGILMEQYRKAFAKNDIVIAQALLTKGDFNNRHNYLNTRDSLLTLINHKIIPIINENDVTAVDEIRFGDNDMLSNYVANIIDADLLIMLSMVDGLYDRDPQAKNGKPKLIKEVKEINSKILKMVGISIAKRSFGGMESKIEACKEAMQGGVPVVIGNGNETDILLRLILKKEALGTKFIPAMKKSEYRKKWILSKVLKSAEVYLDDNAIKALLQGKRSLLGVGVIKVRGNFKRGDSINICNKKGRVIACGQANYSSSEIDKIKGLHSSKIEQVLGINFGETVVHRDNLVVL